MNELTRSLMPILVGLMPNECRKAAEELRRIAAQQDALANADERVGHVLRRVREDAAPRTGGRPKGTGGNFVRWSPGKNHTGQLHVAPKLWRDLGSPKRINVQRIGNELHLRPCEEHEGWAVTLPTGTRGGMPRMSIGQDAADTLNLCEGRSPATIHNGAIVC